MFPTARSVLPPSFPYGGMENPCLTFITPTLIAGDRSLANVVAHEIAHSWTGNLVTNSTWEHFWLNEGFTMFVERKIIGKMFGNQQEEFQAISGWTRLSEEIERLGPQNPHTRLVLENLDGANPDDVCYTAIAYEKGYAFLWYLQTVFGVSEFETFLKCYIQTFSHRALSTDEFKQFLFSHFSAETGKLELVDWNCWLNTPGPPPVKCHYDTSLQDICTNLANKWISAENDYSKFSAEDTSGFTSGQLQEFLDQLISAGKLGSHDVSKMSSLYDNIAKTKNSEVTLRWIRLGLQARYTPAIELAVKMVTENGRMKLVRPIYRDLYNWEEKGREIAIQTFTKNRTTMHNTTANLVAKDLHIQ